MDKKQLRQQCHPTCLLRAPPSYLLSSAIKPSQLGQQTQSCLPMLWWHFVNVNLGLPVCIIKVSELLICLVCWDTMASMWFQSSTGGGCHSWWSEQGEGEKLSVQCSKSHPSGFLRTMLSQASYFVICGPSSSSSHPNDLKFDLSSLQ